MSVNATKSNVQATVKHKYDHFTVRSVQWKCSRPWS